MTSKRKPTHGGKRKGAGRPPASKPNPDRLVRMTIFVHPDVALAIANYADSTEASLGLAVTEMCRFGPVANQQTDSPPSTPRQRRRS